MSYTFKFIWREDAITPFTVLHLDDDLRAFDRVAIVLKLSVVFVVEQNLLATSPCTSEYKNVNISATSNSKQSKLGFRLMTSRPPLGANHAPSALSGVRGDLF